MEIIGSIILFVVFIFAYLLIVEVFVVLFKLTGLSDEKARFQVISMLTNSGYTTQEAELITHSKIRRRLARFVMLFGYAFTVTIVSTVVNIFLQFRNTYIGGAVAFIPMFITILLLVFFIKRNNFIKNIVNAIIDGLARKFIYQGKSNTILIIEEFDDLTIAKIQLNIMPKELEGVSLHESNIKKEYGLNILFKKEATEEILPDGNTIFHIGDIVIVMGSEKNIRKIFDLKEDEKDDEEDDNIDFYEKNN